MRKGAQEETTVEERVRSRIRKKIVYNEDRFRNGPRSQRRYRATELGAAAVKRGTEKAAVRRSSFEKICLLVEKELSTP